jgi:ATPase subunit of ABC transporter with duplicated ATPase domains
MQFASESKSFELPLSALSDGEKCFVLSAVVIAANQVAGPLFAFWDEPDNYLAVSEVNQFVLALKRNFLRQKGQLIITSHNPQAIVAFSEDSTWVMGRRSHMEPAIIRPLEELTQSPNDLGAGQASLMERLLDGDLEPWH